MELISETLMELLKLAIFIALVYFSLYIIALPFAWLKAHDRKLLSKAKKER